MRLSAVLYKLLECWINIWRSDKLIYNGICIFIDDLKYVDDLKQKKSLFNVSMIYAIYLISSWYMLFI